MEKNKTNIELAIELIQRVHEISSKHNEPIDNLFRDALTEYLSKTSEKGIEEAKEAGKVLKEQGYSILE